MAYSKIHSRHELGNLVFYDGQYRHRWLDAIGPNAIVFKEDFAGDIPVVGNSASTWIVSVNDGTCGVASYAIEGGAILLYGAGTDDDELQLQKLSGFMAVDNCPIYFGVRWKLVGMAGASAAVLMGLMDEDTTALQSPNTGIAFECGSADTAIDLVCFASGSAVDLEVAAGIVDGTWYIDEFFWDGAEQIKTWHNGTYIGAASTGSISQGSAMAITIAYADEGGHASAATGLVVDWVRAIQLLDERN